jgi:hypothetical protein
MNPAPVTTLDHITVTAATLAAGAELLRQTLGVVPQPGGEHPGMGTHNLLLRLGEQTFLEVIAPNPAAAPPGRPRWFALDTLAPDAAPALTNWVARTPDMQASHGTASEALGDILPMTRGALNWLITVPADGSLPLGGAVPALIEWQAQPHPAARLPDQGLALQRLELLHPEPQRIQRLLQTLNFQGPVSVALPPAGRTAGLVAHIATPQGPRILSTQRPTARPAQ